MPAFTQLVECQDNVESTKHCKLAIVEAWSCLVHELRGISWNFGLRRVAPSRYKKNGFQGFAHTCSSAVLWTWDFRLLRSNPHQRILANPYQQRGLDEFTRSRSSSNENSLANPPRNFGLKISSICARILISSTLDKCFGAQVNRLTTKSFFLRSNLDFVADALQT